jgi:hypothetical protein
MKRDERNHRSAFETELSVMPKERLPEITVAQGAVQVDKGGNTALVGYH